MGHKTTGNITLRLILLTILGIGLLVTHAGAQSSASMERDILVLINKHRAKKGLEPLQSHGSIATAAEKHSRYMASKRVLGHTGFDSRTGKLLKSIDGANSAAENVAYGSQDAAGVVKMWLNSRGHRKNIEGKYNLTGIGVARSRDGTPYFTQIFINKK